MADADNASSASSSTLTDEQHDWASSFCGIDTRADGQDQAASDGLAGASSSIAAQSMPANQQQQTSNDSGSRGDPTTTTADTSGTGESGDGSSTGDQSGGTSASTSADNTGAGVVLTSGGQPSSAVTPTSAQPSAAKADAGAGKAPDGGAPPADAGAGKAPDGGAPAKATQSGSLEPCPTIAVNPKDAAAIWAIDLGAQGGKGTDKGPVPPPLQISAALKFPTVKISLSDKPDGGWSFDALSEPSVAVQLGFDQTQSGKLKLVPSDQAAINLIKGTFRDTYGSRLEATVQAFVQNLAMPSPLSEGLTAQIELKPNDRIGFVLSATGAGGAGSDGKWALNASTGLGFVIHFEKQGSK